MKNEDIIDNGSEIVIIMNLPMTKKEDIILKFTDKNIIVKAVAKSETIMENEIFLISQKIFKQIYKKINLPHKIIPSKTKSNYSDGVLEIVAPKYNE